MICRSVSTVCSAYSGEVVGRKGTYYCAEPGRDVAGDPIADLASLPAYCSDCDILVI